MTLTTSRSRPLLLLAASVAVGLMLVSAGPGRADSTPVGPLPAGPVATITTKPGLLVAVALPRALTRGDTSAKAVKSATHKVHSA